MKYRLKKDLPFAKAGNIIERIEISNTAMRSYDVVNHKEIRIWLNEESDNDHLINEGWIEEIKPREFYLFDDTQSSEKIFYNTIEEAKADLAQWAVKDLIKVREV